MRQRVGTSPAVLLLLHLESLLLAHGLGASCGSGKGSPALGQEACQTGLKGVDATEGASSGRAGAVAVSPGKEVALLRATWWATSCGGTAATPPPGALLLSLRCSWYVAPKPCGTFTVTACVGVSVSMPCGCMRVCGGWYQQCHAEAGLACSCNLANAVLALQSVCGGNCEATTR